MREHHERLKILNLWVDVVNMRQAIEKIRHFIDSGTRPHSVFAVNPEKNFSIPKDVVLHQAFKDADLLIPDGIGVVLAARILYGKKMSRVTGVDLNSSLCALAAERGYKIFVFGAREEINRKAISIMQERYPGIKIAGRSHGFISHEEMPALIESINASGAEILFLAMGSPRQERWYSAYKHQLTHVKVCQGIGGTLDTITGVVKRAPELWCRYSMEWLYRLLSEPTRIKRQRVLPVFAALVSIEKIKALVGLAET
jgi:N-acetylglucosaminyldiphosphoundecaprenol N-acetyl-beta-D-mannosaminyltransferase